MHNLLTELEVPDHIYIHSQFNSLQYQVKVLLLLFYLGAIQYIYACRNDEPVLVVEEGIRPSAQRSVQIQRGMS